MSEFLATHRDIQEEDEDEDGDAAEGGAAAKQRRDSESFQLPALDDENSAKLRSCMDEIRNVVGETVSERQLVETIMKFNFDCSKSLDAVLNSTTTPPSSRNVVGAAAAIDKLTEATVEKGDKQIIFTIFSYICLSLNKIRVVKLKGKKN